MKNFHCSCGQLLFFDNTQCSQCGNLVAFDPLSLEMVALQTGNGLWVSTSGKLFKLCRNFSDFSVCNWLLDSGSNDDYCIACKLNETIPDLSVSLNREYWAQLEATKRRLIYSLLQLHLPIESKHNNPANGLGFAFLEDQRTNAHVEEEHILTGYSNNVITINLLEVDHINRERQRLHLGEAYRTLLGHFRHESGHYYFGKLLYNNVALLDGFHGLYGDETADYDIAIEQYYQNRPVHNNEFFISAYAQAHPLEDWAETWAHYLHMTDALETAAAHKLIEENQITAEFDRRIAVWMELSVALNSLNRGMGLQDAYPFVLSAPIVDKLRFVENAIQSATA